MKLPTPRDIYTMGCTKQDLSSAHEIEIWFKDDGPHFHAVCFSGKRSKPDINMIFESPYSRLTRVRAWIAGIEALEESKKATREARKQATCPFEVGQILWGSYGYEQTLNEFWQVMEVRGKKITLRRLKVEDANFAGTRIKPIPNEFSDQADPITRIAQTYNGTSWYIKKSKSISLSLWDGTPKYQSY